MFGLLAASVVLGAPPASGPTIRVPRPSFFGAAAADAQTVQQAVRSELEAEGYAVVVDDAKGVTAVVSGTVTKIGASYILNLSLIRVSDGRVLDQVREEAPSAADLPRASTSIAKHMGAALRKALGEALKVKTRVM